MKRFKDQKAYLVFMMILTVFAGSLWGYVISTFMN